MGHDTWRRRRDELFRRHPASPVPAEQRASFGGLHYEPYRPDMRFEAPVDTDVEPQRFEVPTGTDGLVPFSLVGRVHLPVGRLDVWWLESYGGGVFVPIKDASAGSSTYGGGRYLLDTVKGADLGGHPDDGLVIDLNFAYNPSCAYDAAWACPLAPPGNTVQVAIGAGELAPGWSSSGVTNLAAGNAGPG
ncbi:DUF1684 domain-containing protein [Phytoactinopolyspora limicola]|uniref:DUF1684 domain-containing protein n=1 Tax=Phytoactinopolyspora limicola TaxID=2715536 RepID=UPI0024842D03|nr:DUF1684 domain-containing protein [Phytoactinopolyspora limicola]